ncbi:hypothetical protein DFR88_01675 [Metallosphaera sedula]|uniref:Uncharacterized protein n=1 Tax=Metallosphaera prunae TaxID=47304 RepID=A0A4D8RUE2_METPR|nr:hypothetical protein DFR88_01675 [Metallosphaera prunae]
MEGMDPHRGILFSLFFRSFGRGKLAFALPPLVTLLYYSMGMPLLVIPLNTNIIKYIIIYLLIVHAFLKVIMGRFLHYSGSFRPSILELSKWTIINSITQMSFILPMGIYAVNVIDMIIFLMISVVVKEMVTVLCCRSSRVLLMITSYNFDYIYIIGISSLITAILLNTFS